MFLTRSIRQKMVFGLSLVMVMLAVLSLSGLWGLSSYRSLVNDPAIDDRSAASAADVTRAVARLRWTLPQKGGQVIETFDRGELLVRLDRAHDECARYQRRLNELPTATHLQYAVTWQMIGEIEQRLSKITQWLREPDGDKGSDDLQAELERVEYAAAELDEIPDGLRDRLREARHDYRFSFVLISVCSGVVVLLLAALVRFGWRQIFQPINAMHQGARRVAQGDFDYRITVESDDEMGELAESFNLMTERFQETAGNLDRQVQDRSRQLVRSERLASVGLLAAGVAHEINNPLSAIRWAGESLESRFAELLADAPDDEAAVVQQYVAMIQSESERCQEITKRLLDFSRNHDSAKTQQDVGFILREVLSLITHMKKYRECRVEFDRQEPCEIEISGPEIKQVALNLVANALDSTAATGTLRVEIYEQIDWVEILFTDNGSGMSQDTIDHLFEPFYTTKPTGEGTGLGLSISDRIIGDHGGTIEARSDGEGLGSTFTVRLPRKQSNSVGNDTSRAEELVRAIAVR
ncbi:MAG: ATP-binding protein [Planctomycetota bacterium]|nr:ATP-binding protein [Planctomycetota bacterium]